MFKKKKEIYNDKNRRLIQVLAYRTRIKLSNQEQTLHFFYSKPTILVYSKTLMANTRKILLNLGSHTICDLFYLVLYFHFHTSSTKPTCFWVCWSVRIVNMCAFVRVSVWMRVYTHAGVCVFRLLDFCSAENVSLNYNEHTCRASAVPINLIIRIPMSTNNASLTVHCWITEIWRKRNCCFHS